jgi:hypothetical protein
MMRLTTAGLGRMHLVEDRTLTADATTVSFTGLSLGSDASYILYHWITNKDAASRTLSVYVNGDSTANQYYRQQTSANGAVIGTSRDNNAIYTNVNASSVTNGKLEVMVGNDSKAYTKFFTEKDTGAATVEEKFGTITKQNATVSDITQINIVGSSANCIKSGSQFILYKVKA